MQYVVWNDHQHHYKQLYSTQIFIRSEFALDTCFQCHVSICQIKPSCQAPKCGCKWMSSCCTVSYYVTLWKQRRFNNIINVTPLSFFNLINATFLYNTFVYKLKNDLCFISYLLMLFTSILMRFETLFLKLRVWISTSAAEYQVTSYCYEWTQILWHRLTLMSL